MLITFQIILFLLIVLFGLGLFANNVDYEDKNRYVAVVLASIIAECVSFFV